MQKRFPGGRLVFDSVGKRAVKMMVNNDLKDPSVSGLFRLMARLGGGAVKMKIVKIEF